MADQALALQRLRKLIFSLGSFLLIFSLIGFVVLEVYIFTDVTETRLKFLDRTRGYRSDMFRSCICLRNMFLITNDTDPASASRLATQRSNMVSNAKSMSTVHTLNYVSPPTSSVTEYFLSDKLTSYVPSPGVGLRAVKTNFWGEINDLVNAIISASSIPFSDLRHADYSLSSLSVNKRSIIFMYVISLFTSLLRIRT
jgi:hypothetical protein